MTTGRPGSFPVKPSVMPVTSQPDFATQAMDSRQRSRHRAEAADLGEAPTFGSGATLSSKHASRPPNARPIGSATRGAGRVESGFPQTLRVTTQDCPDLKFPIVGLNRLFEQSEEEYPASDFFVFSAENSCQSFAP